MSFGTLQWLFPIVVALHNTEEAIWFPAWTKRTSRWPAPVAPGVFRFAVVVLTVLTFVVTWLSVRSGKQAVWTYLVFGFMVVTLANVLIPHLVVTVVTRRYMPGLVTGLVLNIPVLSLLTKLALEQGYVSAWKAAEYSVGVAALLLVSIPALFKLGKVLNF